MANGAPANTEPESQPVSQVRWLTPRNARIFEGAFSLLHCAVENDQPYRGVFAIRLFAVSFPDEFISLRHTDMDDKVREIGVIRRLTDFPDDAQRLVQESLTRQYYEQVVQRVLDVRCELGLLFFTVETARGREQFVMRWQYDRAEDYSNKGKVLLDVDDNRYIIPDVSALDPSGKRRFTKYIYW